MKLKSFLKKSMLIDKAYRKGFSTVAKVSPATASKIKYFITFGRKLNLKKPSTFNEKLMWLKLNEDDSLKATCADKFLVRDYIEKLGFNNLLNDLYNVYDRPEDISFSDLPNSFVLKCTHGSGCNIICSNKDRLDKEVALSKLKTWFATDYSLISAEPHYSKIKPRIIAEKFLGEDNGVVPIDYKIHCFHGEPQIIEVILDRGIGQKKSIMFDLNWNIMPYTKDALNFTEKIEKPLKLDDMVEIAKTLSNSFTYVRVDLYFYSNRIYFGEFTFTPAGCVDLDLLPDADYRIGELLDLNRSSLNVK
ncbi:ATP-grasp fold amidoligase family protein [Schinkia azotoformans]|uniref:ATP-grasp fold amidoligase family protein n=1 Tax=Schinkia azotoformans TaxID=1454 RepID=UPI002E231897|nr:ATP-grasp fold amidoligase family protein [Schinkia azotoformans]